MEITPIKPEEFDEVLVLWEASVRASHHFLSNKDIEFLKPLVQKEALPNLQLRAIRDNAQKILGFLGVSGDSVETLFVSPEAFGNGIGKALMQYAENEFGTVRVDVNEQNPAALGFYKHLGYQVVSRSPLDGQGRPFPLLHLAKIT